jgi:signal transduction histidine kinase
LLDEFGLADAIEWYATDFARRAALRCDLTVEPVDAVPIEAALAVFRIFQEITTNIARHARASRVQVDLRIRGPYVVLLVTDNGRGMAAQDQLKKGHYGLLGMRERAWAFGGQVWIDSVPGKGTTVRVEMPLPAREESAQLRDTAAA